MLLPHSDVSPELEPKVITLWVSVPTLSFGDHATSDRENCLVLAHFAKQLQKALVCFTHHFLAQNRELFLLPKYIWPLTSSSFSLNSWLGEFCSFNIGKFPIPHKGHLTLGATYLPYASKALYSDLLRVLSASGKGQDLIKMPAVLGELTRWLFCISSFCNYYLGNTLSFIPRSYTTKVF